MGSCERGQRIDLFRLPEYVHVANSMIDLLPKGFHSGVNNITGSRWCRVKHKEEPGADVITVGTDPDIPSLTKVLGKHH